MANNQLKYQQSFHTPFLQSPLHEDFGFKGLTTASQAVLGGVYEPQDDINKHTKDILNELAMPQAIQDLGPQQIAELECELIIIALTSGYSPERWKNLLDVMIMKKSGMTKLASLHTICLFPVD